MPPVASAVGAELVACWLTVVEFFVERQLAPGDDAWQIALQVRSWTGNINRSTLDIALSISHDETRRGASRIAHDGSGPPNGDKHVIHRLLRLPNVTVDLPTRTRSSRLDPVVSWLFALEGGAGGASVAVEVLRGRKWFTLPI
jgi:hypothetical protein